MAELGQQKRILKAEMIHDELRAEILALKQELNSWEEWWRRMQCEENQWGEEDPELVPGNSVEEQEPEKEEGNLGMKVTVMTLFGRKLELSVLGNATVAGLKEMVRQQEGMPPSYQRLIWRGRLLEDSETVRSCGLFPDRVLYVLFDSEKLKANFSTELEPGEICTSTPRVVKTSDLFLGAVPEVLESSECPRV